MLQGHQSKNVFMLYKVARGTFPKHSSGEITLVLMNLPQLPPAFWTSSGSLAGCFGPLPTFPALSLAPFIHILRVLVWA